MMRSGQAAIEYLFMVVVALLMVLLAVKYLQKTARYAMEQANRTTNEVVEIIRNMTREAASG